MNNFETREDILNVDKLRAELEQVTASERILLIANLRDIAEQFKVKSSFNNAIKIAEKSMKVEKINYLDSKIDDSIHQVIQNCGQYNISENGIFIENKDGFQVEVCQHPIFPICILRDVNTQSEKVRITYFKYNKWHVETVDRTKISRTSSIVFLSECGIMVNDNNARYIIQFLADMEKMNNLPQMQTVDKLGWYGDKLIPYSDDIQYSGNNKESEIKFAMYKEHGDKQKWIDSQKEICKHIIPKIIIASSYSSLLNRVFNLNPFIVHLWGETGKGKTVALMCAASIYGYPCQKTGIIYSGSVTNNGLEARLGFVNDITIFLDEISLLLSSDLENLIYLTTQGQGKGRMTKTGNAQFSHTWKCNTISNAENPITNQSSKGGAVNRVINISVKGDSIFNGINLPELCNTIRENYGFGAKLFYDVMQMQEFNKIVGEIRKGYYEQLIEFTEDKQANSMSIIMTTYEIVSKYIHKTDDKLTIEDVKQFLSSKEEVSQVLRSYNRLLGIIQKNYIFFDNTELKTQPKWGSYGKRQNTAKYINILTERFGEICKELNIDKQQFLIGLKQHGLLVSMTENRMINKVRFGDKIMSVYSILLHKPVCNNSQTETEAVEVSDEELPF